MKTDELKLEAVRRHLRGNQVERLLLILVDLNPVDLISILQRLDMKELRQLVGCLQSEGAVKFFEEKGDKRKGLFEDVMGELYAQRITKEMFAEELVD